MTAALGRVRNGSITEVGMGDELVAKVHGRILFEGGELGVAGDRRRRFQE